MVREDVIRFATTASLAANCASGWLSCTPSHRPADLRFREFSTQTGKILLRQGSVRRYGCDISCAVRSTRQAKTPLVVELLDGVLENVAGEILVGDDVCKALPHVRPINHDPLSPTI